MNKLILIVLTILIAGRFVVHQANEDLPKVLLQGIPYKLNLVDINSDYISVSHYDGGKKETFYLITRGQEIDTTISLSSTGYYYFDIPGRADRSSILVLPGFLSVIPPLVAILLALFFRQVLISLIAGIYIGAFFINGYDPLIAFLRLSDEIVLNSVIDKDHMMILLFTLFIGGVVGIISKNGGTAGIADKITRFARKPRSGMLSGYFMGVFIFFDDYANSLLIGNMMRPITDKLKISREKLAYIVDSTAAPIASVMIISTWIGFELGLIGEGLALIGWGDNPYDVFLSTIPYRFYPIAAVFFVFLIAVKERDFGPMYKAEYRARTTGRVFAENLTEEEIDIAEAEKVKTGKSSWLLAVIPIFTLLFTTVAALIYTGIEKLEALGTASYGIQDIITHSDSYASLLWSSLFATAVAILLTVGRKIMSVEKSLTAWNTGVQSMMFACIVLVLAWALSSVTVEMHTADYLISILSDSINPRLLPLLIFIICGAVSFSTGTSWGTMAIVMPIVIPLGFHLSQMNGYDHENTRLIIYGVISSVLAGSVWGDHCSPIADTTILSSMASKCNHIDHVRTQLPYAIVVASVTMPIGDILTAYGLNPFIAIAIIFILLYLIVKFFGKKLPQVTI
ncbi:MAG: Na+/H+ antiporter NhaC family protein [Ignavibacteriales bacterium]|nr:Na+/H+ antiporter NhaC family protein [Ignavibacteriales bacterium]MCF8306400.1 Na+/H+ antiporter NhaC family protein [Ignavibacteriales bacterium]MCF8435745.1 Na+/H+ antiporter NhaC family protein [Ignavibacteriales bacterium]